jgi:hypothetical protein
VQEPLEPGHRLGVEVVGGLVEQQQVGGRQQEPAQGHAAALAAREGADVGIAGGHPQGVHGHLHLAVEVPGARGIDLVLQLRLLGQQGVHVGVRLGEGGADLLVARHEVGHGGHAQHDVAEDVERRVEHRLLGEVAHREAGGQPGLARVPVVLTGHDAQQ